MARVRKVPIRPGKVPKKNYQKVAKELLKDPERARRLLEQRAKQNISRTYRARAKTIERKIKEIRRVEAFKDIQSFFKRNRVQLEARAEEERRRVRAVAGRKAALARARVARAQQIRQRQITRQNALRNLRKARALKRGYRDQNPWYDSSNVEMLGYDSATNTVYVRFHEGGEYFYYHVPEYIYEDVYQGLEWCRTEGQNQWGRWWRGKYPSLGAAVHWILVRGGYEYERIS